MKFIHFRDDRHNSPVELDSEDVDLAELLLKDQPDPRTDKAKLAVVKGGRCVIGMGTAQQIFLTFVKVPMTTDQNLLLAIQCLRQMTGNDRYDVWQLMGDRASTHRQKLMQVLLGTKKLPPKSKCGVIAIRSELLRRTGLRDKGSCIAERDELLSNWCRANETKSTLGGS
jgi:hypothetical protein